MVIADSLQYSWLAEAVGIDNDSRRASSGSAGRVSGVSRLIQSGYPDTENWSSASVPWSPRSARWSPRRVALTRLRVVMLRNPWSGSVVCDGRRVRGIGASLEPVRRVEGRAQRLIRERSTGFVGSLVNCASFVLESADAQRLTARDPRNAEVVVPYLSGADVNEFPFDDHGHFGLLSFSFHWWWARSNSGLFAGGSVPNYAQSDV